MFLPYEAAPVLDLTTEGDRWKIQLDYRGPVPRAWRVDRRDLGGRGRRCVDVDGRRPGHRRGVHHILAGDRPAQTREEDAARVVPSLAMYLGRLGRVHIQTPRRPLLGGPDMRSA